jgi:UDP-GlcNAc:undecaprenyl-phosphate GlcNAc-1-phosphate transferase
MTPLFLVFGLAFVICVCAMPGTRRLAIRARLMDHPDARRKLHHQPVPLAGGITVLLATTLAVAAVLVVHRDSVADWSGQITTLVAVLVASVLICAVGVVDDLGLIRGRHKLVGQIVAAGIVVGSGVAVRQVAFFDCLLPLGIFAKPLTILWLVGAINALNLLDGMDGLLGNVGLILLTAVGLIAMLGGHTVTAIIALGMAGALLGFLCFNMPPASVFLGDAGSMLIGLLIGVLAILGSLKGAATIALTVPAILLTVPFFDTLMAIIRRTLTGRSIYATDRGHLHHCLLQRGLRPAWVVFAIAGACALTGLAVFISLWLKNELVAVVAGVAVLGILVTARLFGYSELLLLSRFVRGRAALALGHRGNGIWHVQAHLQGNMDWDGLWEELLEYTKDAGLLEICLDINAPSVHESYHADWRRLMNEELKTRLWHADMPVVVGGQVFGCVKISGMEDRLDFSEKLAGLAKVVQAFVPRQAEASSRMDDTLAETTNPVSTSQQPRPRSDGPTTDVEKNVYLPGQAVESR